MKVVFASHTFMGSAFVVGSRHLARELARNGHRVAAVSGISQVTFRCWWCPKKVVDNWAGEHDHPQGAPFRRGGRGEGAAKPDDSGLQEGDKRAEMIIACAYLAATNARRLRRALQGLFGAGIGKDTVSLAWHKVQADGEAWLRRDVSGEDIVRLILDGTATNICLLAVMGPVGMGRRCC